jgi:hypothetical protein
VIGRVYRVKVARCNRPSQVAECRVERGRPHLGPIARLEDRAITGNGAENLTTLSRKPGQRDRGRVLFLCRGLERPPEVSSPKDRRMSSLVSAGLVARRRSSIIFQNSKSLPRMTCSISFPPTPITSAAGCPRRVIKMRSRCAASTHSLRRALACFKPISRQAFPERRVAAPVTISRRCRHSSTSPETPAGSPVRAPTFAWEPSGCQRRMSLRRAVSPFRPFEQT